MSKLTGKVAVVTGASKGIGASIAEHLAAEGASVVVDYASSKSGADEVVRHITEKGGKAIAVQADVSKPKDITRLFAETKAAYGKLDILVNNAGVYEFAPLEAVTADHFHKLFDLNVLGLLLTTKEAVKLMNGEGSVLNIGSIVGHMPVGVGSRLQRDQGSGRRVDCRALERARAQEDPGQFTRSRHGGHRGIPFRRPRRKRVPQGRRIADPAGPHRKARRRRPRRRVLFFRRRRLGHRTIPYRGRRLHAITSAGWRATGSRRACGRARRGPTHPQSPRAGPARCPRAACRAPRDSSPAEARRRARPSAECRPSPG